MNRARRGKAQYPDELRFTSQYVARAPGRPAATANRHCGPPALLINRVERLALRLGNRVLFRDEVDADEEEKDTPDPS